MILCKFALSCGVPTGLALQVYLPGTYVPGYRLREIAAVACRPRPSAAKAGPVFN